MKNDNITGFLVLFTIAALVLMFGYKFLGLPGLIFIIVGIAIGITCLVQATITSSRNLKYAGFAILIIAVVGAFSIKNYMDSKSVQENESISAESEGSSESGSGSGNSSTYESCAARLGPGLERCMELPESMWESCRRSYLSELESCTSS
jgi:hypothetical protein